MSYESTSIARIITRLNVEYFLPAIQRPYVWKPEQLIRLFDSILKGYPISSFLFWDLKQENKRNWDIYKFIENFTFGNTHNEIASTDGLNINLVLDGQQRLTSLYIGLKGTYTTKRKYQRSNSINAWVKQQLHLDLLKDPKIDDEDVSTEVSYGLAMFESTPPNTDKNYWFRVGEILEFDDFDKFDEYKEKLIDELPDTMTRAEEKLLEKNLNRLRKVIWEDDVISYYTEVSQSYDRVLDIFIRANDGGTKLSKSDLLLSMMTPLGWLERVPTYKDQQEKLKEKDLATYGFLGYPLLQSADILIYRAGRVPVGADQVSHVEMTREVARRFNHLYGKDPGYEDQAEAAIQKMGKKNAKLYRNLRKRFLEQGDEEALETAQALIKAQQNVSIGDRERLIGYIEGGGKVILPEPQALLTPAAKMPGLDGQKMSKSYGNTIGLREDPDTVVKKIRTMQTDPQRVRLSDPGDPAKCPVWQLHEVYSDDSTKSWVQEGCRSAGIGCLDCKKPIIDAVLEEQKPIHERAKQYEENPELVRSIIAEGTEKARDAAKATLEEVRRAMGLSYR